MPIGGDDISNDVTTLVFQCLFTFALLPLRADWRKFDSSVDGEKGNWRWNSNSRGVIASSPFFSAPPTERPGELGLSLIRLKYIGPGSAVA